MLRLGGGNDLVAFHKGDGTDRIEGERQDGVLVIGGVRYQDLLSARPMPISCSMIGGRDRLVFDDWYRGKQSIATLEVIGAPSAGDHVETYDFRALVAAFDEAWGRGTCAAGSDERAPRRALVSSDHLALGGDLAYQYGMTGTLAARAGAARATPSPRHASVRDAGPASGRGARGRRSQAGAVDPAKGRGRRAAALETLHAPPGARRDAPRPVFVMPRTPGPG